MATATPQTRCRCSDTRFGIARLAIAGMLLTLAGCGEFASQQQNAEGVRLFQRGQYAEAMRDFEEATYDNPKDADGYYNIAATYHRMGRQDRCESDLKQAEKFYNDCLDRNPNHTECYRGLAVLLAEEGRKDAAFRLLQGWVDREPTSADAKVELARLYDEHGDRQVAKNYLIEALEAKPDDARALTALGTIRYNDGDKTQALANYQRSLGRDSRQPEVASRVMAMQTATVAATAAANGAAPPTVDLGTRMADRSAPPLR